MAPPRTFAIRSPRQQRTARRILELLAEGLHRGIVRDRRLRDGAAVSLTAVEVSPDLQLARVFWVAAAPAQGEEARLQAALNARKGAMHLHINAYLRQRRATKLEFVHETVRASPHERRLGGLFAAIRAAEEPDSTNSARDDER